MAQAKKQRSTPRRRAASKKQQAASKSVIIEQCVIYLQSVAAYSAGCEADGYNCDIAGAGAPLGKEQLEAADRALNKLVGLSASRSSKTPLSIPEIRAKAAVCEGMMKFNGPNVLETAHILFLQGFAHEVRVYFKQVEASNG